MLKAHAGYDNYCRVFLLKRNLAAFRTTALVRHVGVVPFLRGLHLHIRI